MSTKTESAEQFMEYLLTKRPELIRKNTNLKLEGDMYIQTENLAKYVAHGPQERPPLIKKTTNLHMEGEIETKTEKNEQYVQYKLDKRPPLRKRDTNLHMEGTLSMVPEYKARFVEYNKADRPMAILPIHNLKPGGEFEMETENKARFQYRTLPKPEPPPTKPVEEKKAAPEKPPVAQIRPRESKRIDNNPEYAHTFEMTGIPGITREYTNPSTLERRARSRGRSRINSLSGDVYHDENDSRYESRYQSREISPDLSKSYTDLPREQQVISRTTHYAEDPGPSRSRAGSRAETPQFTRSKSRMKKEFLNSSEGLFECQPEYRKAYTDYLIREKADRLPRPIERMVSPTPPRVFADLEKTEAENKLAVPEEGKSKLLLPPKSGHPKSLPKSGGPVPPKQSPTLSKTPLLPGLPPPIIKNVPVRRSVSPNPRSIAKSAARQKKLSRIENELFGPRLSPPVSSSSFSSAEQRKDVRTRQKDTGYKSRSRRTSPVVSRASSRNRKRIEFADDDDYRSDDREYRRYSYNSSMEESDFAQRRPPTRVYIDDSDYEREQSFVVLKDPYERERPDSRQKFRYIEQKWMPSWYNPPM